MDTVAAPDTSPRVRLLAVLAADAVGYSRLMSLDDRGTVAALDAARAVFRIEIAGHAGRVIDMAGDSVLAVFENATAAVQAALAIQRRLSGTPDGEISDDRPMRFRIGVHLGDVIEKADGSVYGDGVNIAARLESLAAPGGVAVSEAVRTTVRGRLEACFEDQGMQRVKNIADPVRVFAVSPGSAASSAQPSPAAPDSPCTEDGAEGQPGIAVLPFESAEHNPEQSGFADGLVDDIVGLLAGVPGLIVIAHSSTFSYKGRVMDARAVGHELGVRYVVGGSLRVVEQRMRLHVSLVDCRSHVSLWSERFDAPLEDLFVVQDEITAQILHAVRATIGRSEARSSRRLTPQSLQAWQLRAQTYDHYRRWNRTEMLLALELSRRAVELAPNEADGYANLAACLWGAAISGWLPSGAPAMEEALAMATRAINLDEALPKAQYCMATVLLGVGRHDEAIAAAERARELGPADFGANNMLGQALAYGGRYEEALPYFERALRLSPKDPLLFSVYQSRSIAQFGLGRYPELVADAQRVARQLPEWVEAHTLLAAGLVGLGRLEQATQAIDSARKLDERLSVRRVMRRHPIRKEEDAARLAAFLRDAGLVEA